MNESTFAKCPVCGNEVHIPRRTAFKSRCTKAGALGGMVAGAAMGAAYGTGAGIASGGTAAPATIPFGIVGGAVGGMSLGIAGRMGAEWVESKVTCSSVDCNHTFRI